MTSTRNKNTAGNYCLEQRSYMHSELYTTYKNSMYGEAYDPKLPGNGLLAGQMPWNQLSYNAPDIESFLFGINTCDLTKPAPPTLVPALKDLESANVFEKAPVYLPQPLAIEKHQRPFPVPN